MTLPRLIFVKPREGYKIHDPFRQDFLPATGRDVHADDLHWVRLLMDGDIVRAEPPVADEPASTLEQPSVSIDPPHA